MIEPPFPADEAERLSDLRALNILDSPPEDRFDRLVRLAAAVFGVPIAYVALIDADRQWFKAKCGLTTDETGRNVSFCGHAILQDEPLVIPDASVDRRFRDNPLVVGEPYLRFYAGCPLSGPGGHKVGTFCIGDHAARTFDEDQRAQLRQFAVLAEHELNMVELIETQRQLLDTKNKLVATQQRLAEELAEAAAYVRSLLPAKLTGSIRTDWQYVSSSHLGGDLFGYHWLDDTHLAFYELDACGHGVTASLLSISVFNALRRQTLPDTEFHDPTSVLEALNRAFPMQAHGRKFTTVWYGVYESATRSLRYASAGHPPGLLYEPGADAPIRLGRPNFPIGAQPDGGFEGGAHTLAPASRLYVFSDGVYEIETGAGKLLMLEGLSDLLSRSEAETGASRTKRVLEQARALHGASDFDDDFLLLEASFA
ncbi:MAG: PP2C family protein-serine/threonine phosphatase, partial [Planctomycetota bacterium]|jgi:sigma-B regulation protein RsbU (phosphoserine phosphatase)